MNNVDHVSSILIDEMNAKLTKPLLGVNSVKIVAVLSALECLDARQRIEDKIGKKIPSFASRFVGWEKIEEEMSFYGNSMRLLSLTLKNAMITFVPSSPESTMILGTYSILTFILVEVGDFIC